MNAELADDRIDRISGHHCCYHKIHRFAFLESVALAVESELPNCRAADPWVRFSPFFPHGGIPVPLATGVVSQSVEGIWQGLKVFETCGIDVSKFEVTNMKGLKRTARKHGRVLGHQAGVDSDELLPYVEARRKIYLPAYAWVLENRLGDLVDELCALSRDKAVVLLDYETNGDVNATSRPLSHAALIKQGDLVNQIDSPRRPKTRKYCLAVDCTTFARLGCAVIR